MRDCNRFCSTMLPKFNDGESSHMRRIKVKVTPCTAQSVGGGIAQPIRNPALEGGWSAPCSGRFSPGKDSVPICKRLSGPRGRSRPAWKISRPWEFHPRPVQPQVIIRIIITPCSKALLSSQCPPNMQKATDFSPRMEPKVSITVFKTATGPHPEPNKNSSQPPTLLLYRHISA